MIETCIRVEPRPDGVRIVYETGLKTATEFNVEPPAVQGGQDEAGTDSGASLS